MKRLAALGQAFSGDAGAESLQGLDRAFLQSVLLSGLAAIVPLRLIERPLQEEVVPNSPEFMGDGHRRFLAPEAPFKTPTCVAEEGWGVACGPGTRPQHPTAEIAIPFARAARTPLTRTFIMPRTLSRTGGEPGRRPNVARLRADLG